MANQAALPSPRFNQQQLNEIMAISDIVWDSTVGTGIMFDLVKKTIEYTGDDQKVKYIFSCGIGPLSRSLFNFQNSWMAPPFLQLSCLKMIQRWMDIDLGCVEAVEPALSFEVDLPWILKVLNWNCSNDGDSSSQFRPDELNFYFMPGLEHRVIEQVVKKNEKNLQNFLFFGVSFNVLGTLYKKSIFERLARENRIQETMIQFPEGGVIREAFNECIYLTKIVHLKK